MKSYDGNWVDATLQFSAAQESQSPPDYEISLTVFIVPEEPPDAGFDGVMGMAALPTAKGFTASSVMSQL